MWDQVGEFPVQASSRCFPQSQSSAQYTVADSLNFRSQMTPTQHQ